MKKVMGFTKCCAALLGSLALLSTVAAPASAQQPDQKPGQPGMMQRPSQQSGQPGMMQGEQGGQPGMMQGQQGGQRGMMERPMADLKSLPPEQQIASMRYCESVFHVTTAEGDTLDFPEFNLRLKVDGTDMGPPAGMPALLSAGMMGDRAFVVFADPAEISDFIQNEC